MPKKKSGEPTKAELAKAAAAKKKSDKAEAKAAKLAEKEAAKAAKKGGAVPQPTAAPKAPGFPKFENAQVVEKLSEIDNGFILCRMSDGTTKHVPAELF